MVDALAERILRPQRLRQLLADLLDDSSATMRKRQANLQTLRTERPERDPEHVDFIEQGIVSPRDADFTGRLASQGNPAGRAPARNDGPSDYPQAIDRLDEIVLGKPHWGDPAIWQGYACRFTTKVVVGPDTNTLTGPIKSLELAMSVTDQQAHLGALS